MIEFISNLDETYKGIILGGVIGLLSGLVASWYTSNKNWKQEKYFKLQQIAEEIIFNLRKLENDHNVYKLEKELIDDCAFSPDLHSKYCEKLYEIGKSKRQANDVVFSKIQVYFSEFGLTKVRDISVKLSKLLNAPENKDNDKKISDVCVELKEAIIISVKRYGRSRIMNKIYYWIEKYN